MAHAMRIGFMSLYRDRQTVIGTNRYAVSAVDDSGLESETTECGAVCLELCWEGVPFNPQCGLHD